ncbi:MAG TPA: pirin family protein [Asticcacaulis sp.]|nr:pirin family protein [Asticcacaulis sp.]
MSTLTETKARTIQSTHQAFHTLEGDGFEVARAIPSNAYEAIGPFIFLDQFGPIDVAPGEAKGASAHPHAGIETLTLLLEGRSVHKDSLGNESVMQPGEAQWMRAGRGIIHDEGPDAQMRRTGGRNHGVQLWLNLPKGHKHDAPMYRHVKASEIPHLQGGKALARLVAGRSGATEGPLSSFGAPFVAHVSLQAGGHIEIEADPAELALYVMTGNVAISAQTVPVGWLARLTPGDTVALSADAPAEALLIGGDPLDAPILRHGPFVMNTIDELEQAVRDYYAGRMGRIG